MKEMFKEDNEVAGLLCIQVEDNAVHGVQRASNNYQLPSQSIYN